MACRFQKMPIRAKERRVRGLWNSGSTAPRCGDTETDYQQVRLAAYPGRGRVLWEEFGKWEIVGPGRNESGTFAGSDAWVENNLKAQAAFHNAMFDCVEDDAKVPGTNFRHSLHEWEATLALYLSALERRPVDLRDFDPPVGLFDRLTAALGK